MNLVTKAVGYLSPSFRKVIGPEFFCFFKELWHFFYANMQSIYVHRNVWTKLHLQYFYLVTIMLFPFLITRRYAQAYAHNHSKMRHKRTNIIPYKTWISWTWSKNRNTNRFLMVFFFVFWSTHKWTSFIYWKKRQF